MTDQLLKRAADAREFVDFVTRPFSQEEAESIHRDRLDYMATKAKNMALEEKVQVLEYLVHDKHKGNQDLVEENVKLRAEVAQLKANHPRASLIAEIKRLRAEVRKLKQNANVATHSSP